MPEAPEIRFFVSMPGGDMPVDQDMLNAPLPIGRNPEQGGEDAPTFGDYFSWLEAVLSQDGFAMVLEGVRQEQGRAVDAPALGLLRVIAEKHGAFYHPARIEAVTESGTVTLGANAALSAPGQALAGREFATLRTLGERFSQSFAPRAFAYAQAPFLSQGRGAVPAALFLCQWFEGFCEFHLSCNPDSGRTGIRVWDNSAGHFFLTPDQSRDLHRQAAHILAYYYEPETGRQILPWHHAAGDFVARTGRDGLQVRLITARGYDSLAEPEEDSPAARVEAGIFFLANLTLRMRLDRLDGTGDLAFADDAAVAPTLQGFFSGLELRGREPGRDAAFARTLWEVCREMDASYWEDACLQLIQACAPAAPDIPVLVRNAAGHAQALVEALFKWPGTPFFVDKGRTLL